MKRNWILWVGDGIVLGVVTITGFVTHGELVQAGWRMLTTFLPLCAAWMVVGLPGQLFDASLAVQPRQLWRPLWAMLAAGPLAALLRSLLLGGQPVIPLFAVVLTVSAAIGVCVWRWVFFLVFRGKG